ncbi:hypothetical protein G7054_g904 [Neopestalotiopsis clavispora]|nr:hypothetical protein G7054_g904 [Neopestalotiopsis clavispora]
MLAINYEQFEALLGRQPWIRELAGILPLSALFDFLDMARILHLFQLSGAIPIWCWPVAPSGSRLLLDSPKEDGYCCLDRFENQGTPVCIDGRYGDEYFTPNPETVQLSVNVANPEKVSNLHENMKRNDNRLQNLEIVCVNRQPLQNKRRWQYMCSISSGWILLTLLVVAGIILERWLVVAYLTTVFMTGAVVSLLYGRQPRKLANHERGSSYTRLIVVAKHMNEKNWQVFVGESSIVNALLNKPLESDAKIPRSSTTLQKILYVLLQGLILAQWGAAVGSAVMKSWDAFAISFWVVFCIFSHNCFFSSERIGEIWLAESAGISIRRYETQLSTRRALLNTIMALNPDTFAKGQQTLEEFDKQALKWIDPILKESVDRDSWQEASRLALIERNNAGQTLCGEGSSSMTHAISPWQDVYGHHYWCKYIPEGIDMAIKIGETAGIRIFTSLNSKNVGLLPTEKGKDKEENDDQPSHSSLQLDDKHFNTARK